MHNDFLMYINVILTISMAAKIAGLLNWCKIQCDGYKDVTITNFTSSWKSGLAFCAILHRYRPDLIDYDSLTPNNTYGNSKLAFDVALSLGIPALLDPEDMVVMTVPDKLCIITYVSQYCNFFQDKPKDGGPSVKTATKRSSNNKDVEPPEKKLLPANSDLQTNKRGTLEDKCLKCKKKVYLLERHISNNKLYHRHCFRELDRISTLERNKGTEELLAASKRLDYSVPLRKSSAVVSNDNQSAGDNTNLASINVNNKKLVSNKSPTPFNNNHLACNKTVTLTSLSVSNASVANLAKESIVEKTHVSPSTPLIINNKHVSPVTFGYATRSQVCGSKQDSNKLHQTGPGVARHGIKPSVNNHVISTVATKNNTTNTSSIVQSVVSSKNVSSKLLDLITKFEDKSPSPSKKSEIIKESNAASILVTKFSANISPSAISSTPSVLPPTNSPSRLVTTSVQSITVPTTSPSRVIATPFQSIIIPTTLTTSFVLSPAANQTISSSPQKPTSNESNISKMGLQIAGPAKDSREIISSPIKIANKKLTSFIDDDKNVTPIPKAKQFDSEIESSSLEEDESESETEDIERSLNQPDLNNWRNSAKAGVFRKNVSSDKIEKVVGVHGEDTTVKKCKDFKMKFWRYKNQVEKRKVYAEASPSKEEIVALLRELDGKLVEVEEEGRKLEENIRSCSEEKMEEEEELMKKWLHLVKKRSDLIREESDLIYQKKQQILEKQHEDLEYHYRLLSSIPENEKNEAEKKIEDQLVHEIMTTVNDRNKIVDNIESDRIRYKEEDEQYDKLLTDSKPKKKKQRKFFTKRSSSNGPKKNKKNVH